MNVPVLLQTDPRWKNQRLGTNNAATIGGYGCAVTCVTMKNLYYGGTEGLVNNVDDVFTNEGAYVDGNGHRSPQMGCSMLDWSRINACLPHVTHVSTGFYATVPADLSRIKASIDAGHPVTLEVRWEGHPDMMHFVEADAYNGNDIIVNCPEVGRTAFSSRKYGTGDAAKDIINAHFFTGPLSPGHGAVAAPNPEEVHMTADQETQAYEIVLGRKPENPAVLGKRTAMDFILGAKPELDQQRNGAASTEAGLRDRVNVLEGELQRATDILAKQSATMGALNRQLQASVPEYVHTFTDAPVRDVLTDRAVIVRDFAGQQPDRPVPVDTIIETRGTFTVGGLMYYRTAKAVAGGYYYGVPVTDVTDYVPPKAVATLNLSASQSVHAVAADGLNGWSRFISKLNPFGGKQ